MSKFQVRLTSPGSKIVLLVRALRLVADLRLLEAKQLSDYLRDHAPCVVVAGVGRDVADHVAGLFRDAGADAVVEETSLDVPMLLCPAADRCYRWHWFIGATPVS